MEIINPLFSFYNPLRKIPFLEQHHASPGSLVFCLIPFMLSFSNTVLVSNILEQSAVVLKRHSFICSLLPSFSSFQFSSTRLLPSVHLPQVRPSQPAQGRTSTLPRGCSAQTACATHSPRAALRVFGHYPLPDFSCPWYSLFPIIYVQTDYF